MDEQTHSTAETISSEETNSQINTNANAEQNERQENGGSVGQEDTQHVDFAQMYDMLTERDTTIKSLQSEVVELKKTNTQLLLKVNASTTGSSQLKNPFEAFVDSMAMR